MPTAPRRPKPTTSASNSKPAGCAPPSCSPLASILPGWPASWASPARPPAPGTPPGRPVVPAPLASRGPTGPTPRLGDQELARVEQALLEGATAHGFEGELWTLDRIAKVIWRLSGVRHHPAHVWALLRYRMGWTVQRPAAARPNVTRPLSTIG
jgi:Winged helix-turn helix